MSEVSARLDLPLIQPSQAQKHVTHNEALLRLDGLTQMAVSEFGTQTPPETSADGQIYALGNNPTGEWDGQADNLAIRTSDAWLFLTPQDGWRAWDLTDGAIRVFQAGSWDTLTQDMNNLDGIGIRAAWDSVNRLSVSSQASLFNHDGAGHQLKVNKAAAAETASLLFQSGFTGHAEMGLAGDTAFSVKVSADGSNWSEAMRADPATGQMIFDQPMSGQAIQQSADDTTAGRLMRADWGYGPGTILGTVSQAGGVPTGALIETGSNANGTYRRWADGTQICTRDDFTIDADNAAQCDEEWTFPASFAATPDYFDICLSYQSSDWSVTALRADVSGTGVLSPPSATSATLGFYSSAGPITVSVSGCRCMAVGRWYSLTTQF